MKRFRVWEWIAVTFILIGALNWGLIGFFRFDLVAALFGIFTIPARVIYALVGLAGIYFIIYLIES